MEKLTEQLERHGMYIALLAAWVAMLGSLYLSEVLGFIPCTLCWYQRILMYPLAGIIAVGLLRRDENLPIYVLPFSVLGLGFSTYHYLLQKTDLINDTATCKVGVPCSSIWINWGGFITIPFLALTAFLIITVVTGIVWQAAPDEDEDEVEADEEEFGELPVPWLPVGGVIGAVTIVFLVMALASGNAEVEASSPSTISTTKNTSVTIDGGLLYQQACAACHGRELEGVDGLGNTLAPSTFVDEQSDDDLLAFITAGRGLDDDANTTGLVMPESGGRPDLNDDEMLAIITYIRSQGSE